jgi:hypothetical protein
LENIAADEQAVTLDDRDAVVSYYENESQADEVGGGSPLIRIDDLGEDDDDDYSKHEPPERVLDIEKSYRMTSLTNLFFSLQINICSGQRLESSNFRALPWSSSASSLRSWTLMLSL